MDITTSINELLAAGEDAGAAFRDLTAQAEDFACEFEQKAEEWGILDVPLPRDYRVRRDIGYSSFVYEAEETDDWGAPVYRAFNPARGECRATRADCLALAVAIRDGWLDEVTRLLKLRAQDDSNAAAALMVSWIA